MRLWAFLLCYVIVSSTGLLLLKQGLSAGRGQIDYLRFAVGFVLYAGGFLAWLWMLSKFPLHQLFPLASGGLIIGSTILAVVILGERMSWQSCAGIVLIITGIFFLGKAS
jgi:multidrug transporter EmrE-like cation transporter